MQALFQAKNNLRKTIKKNFSRLRHQNKIELDLLVQEAFLESAYFKEAEHILSYHSLADEVSTLKIMESILKQGKKLYLPKCGPKTLSVHLIEDLEKDLSPGMMRIQEPTTPVFEKLNQIELCLVPGRAIDTAGNRLGRGAGYYDELLPNLSKSRTLGIFFDFQVQESIPVNENDVGIQAFLTEKGFTHIRQ